MIVLENYYPGIRIAGVGDKHIVLPLFLQQHIVHLYLVTMLTAYIISWQITSNYVKYMLNLAQNCKPIVILICCIWVAYHIHKTQENIKDIESSIDHNYFTRFLLHAFLNISSIESFRVFTYIQIILSSSVLYFVYL